ncbi:lysylphosphatidylglycerol synthase transmembrane domain-containing protein [Leptospira koniambonensis]|uniref:lysylphosphatidylglycerol synthase transmembrane domain-containing protein n=1 Tax=Leptospira koniambonensis TaxID=2484950 RepID=UPI003EBA31CB
MNLQHIKSYLFFFLRILFAIALGSYVFLTVDFASVWDALLQFSIPLFLVSFCLSTICSIVIPAMTTNRALRVSGIDISLWESIKINFSMRLYVMILPQVLSSGIRWFRYRGPEKGKGWEAASIIFFEKIVQLFFITFSTLVFFLIKINTIPEVLKDSIPLIGLFTFTFFALIVLFLSPYVFGLFGFIFKFVRNHFPHFIASRVDKIEEAIQVYHKLGKRSVALMFFGYLSAHLIFILSSYVLGIGLGIEMDYIDMGWVRSIVLTLSALPITVGGLGVRELGHIYLMGYLGVDKSTAVTFSLLIFAIQILIALLGACFEIWRFLLKSKKGFAK